MPKLQTSMSTLNVKKSKTEVISQDKMPITELNNEKDDEAIVNTQFTRVPL